MRKIVLLGLILFSFSLTGFAATHKTKGKGIRKLILVHFKNGTTDKQIASIDSLARVVDSKVKAISKLEWGGKMDENGATTQYDYCLMLEFKNSTDLEIFRQNPVQLQLMGKLIPLSDKILNFTYLIDK